MQMVKRERNNGKREGALCGAVFLTDVYKEGLIKPFSVYFSLYNCLSMLY
jgi:hypothetical protein